MFIRTDDGVYESTLLRGQSWLSHGFSSRRSSSWPGHYTGLKQIHSSIVAVADPGRDLPEHGDAILTQRVGEWVGIRTADCVPLLIADPYTQVVGAIHAGWRGTVAEIACRTVETMVSEYGSDPTTLVAAIGPCISACCFEVGPEVGQQFEAAFPERIEFGRVDLPEANRRQLLRAGLSEKNIDTSGICTACDESEFHSWRRDKDRSGRMVAAIQIRQA